MNNCGRQCLEEGNRYCELRGVRLQSDGRIGMRFICSCQPLIVEADVEDEVEVEHSRPFEEGATA